MRETIICVSEDFSAYLLWEKLLLTFHLRQKQGSIFANAALFLTLILTLITIEPVKTL